MADEGQRRPGKPGGRMPAFKQARYQQILDAALEVLHDAEYEQIKVDDVARRAGLAKATLYRYFTSKDQLYAVVLRRWDEHEHQRPLPPSEPGAARVRGRAEATIAAYERHPQFFRLDVQLFSSEDAEVRAQLSALAARTHQLYAADFAAHGVASPHDAAAMLQAIARSALTNAVFHGAPFSTVHNRVARFIDLYEPSGEGRPVPETAPLAEPAAIAGEPLSGSKRQRHDRILRTAREALEEQPYEHVHISEIAQRAGIALGTLYRYFASKEYLYAIVIHEWFLTSRFLLPFDDLSPAERIRSRIRAAVDAFEARPRFFRLNSLLYSALDPAVQGVMRAIFSHARRLFANDFRALGVADPDDTAAMLWAILHSLTNAALSYDTSFPEVHRIADEFVALAVQSTRAPLAADT
ncbi:TetR/AcrR family transcriptional regulator [Actinomadura rugatobispora]|uniref:TetR/AcrR family transcriptional regulator n=1 Tax=Actinomadura rugatobispora TaxID=1994 RepID=A0ABW0ZXA3_9ACTN|nr:hypothetical protein GCM10010200_111380 [Actinomadura rugatobispora]